MGGEMTVYITFVNGQTQMFEAEKEFLNNIMERLSGNSKATELIVGNETFLIFWNQVTMIKIVEDE